ncbi:MAG: hypothetical protein FH759_08785 [Sediminimonas qiaohouensis]|uniref:Uncharacterized protein n=1 Tax=Sediminimonas qiaohouensis TaxID=552061 RepID=A0A7C9HB82_9RHOB|nr:hypothetical protein [Sediminimonas qiaohouensis]MTJ04770.1 hypothetical protein [Sediminimonas qiaohouensis]
MTDPNDILNQIRARGDLQDTGSDEQSSSYALKPGFRALLEAKSASRPKRTLSADEQKKLAALEDIKHKLEQRQHVQNRRLQNWLTVDEYAAIDELWDEQRDLREELKDKPDAIVEYEERLRRAIFYDNRANHYRKQGKSRSAEEMRSKSVSALEDMLERYAEMIQKDLSLHSWFDRQLDWAHGGDATADLASVPRVITSSSSDAMHNKMTKREVKLSVVERAIYNLLYE